MARFPIEAVGRLRIEARDLAGNIAGDEPKFAGLRTLRDQYAAITGEVQLAAVSGKTVARFKDFHWPIS